MSGKDKVEELVSGAFDKPPMPPSEIVAGVLKKADGTVDETERRTVEALQVQFAELEKLLDKQPGKLIRIQTLKQMQELLDRVLGIKATVARLAEALVAAEPDDDELRGDMQRLQELTAAVIGLATYVPEFALADTKVSTDYRKHFREQGADARRVWKECLKKSNGNEDIAGIRMLIHALERVSGGDNKSLGDMLKELGLPEELVRHLETIVNSSEVATGQPASKSGEAPAEETPWDEMIKKAN